MINIFFKQPNQYGKKMGDDSKESTVSCKIGLNNKSDESDYEEFDATQHKLSEYEAARIKNIHRNKQILQSFNILEVFN